MKWTLSIFIALAAPLILFSGCERPQPVEAASAPKETRFIPPEERDPDRLWCGPHDVYEDQCYICHPELEPTEAASDEGSESAERDPDRLWCSPHDVYEDECYICHPELEPKASAAKEGSEERDPNRLWCSEHGLYEDECEICHPGITAAKAGGSDDLDHAEHGGHSDRAGVLWCNEHDLAEQECGTCQPQLLADLPIGGGMKLRVAEPAALQTAGLSTTIPEAGDAGSAQELLGRISYNRNELAVVTPLAAGVISEVKVDVGQKVDANELLAVARAPEIAEGATAYLKALADADYKRKVHEREKDLFTKEISARQDYEAAEAAWQASRSEIEHGRQHLLNLGMSEAEVDALTGAGSYSTELPVRAPFAGTIVEREAVLGTAVEPGDVLFRVADLSSMWLTLSVPESRLGALEEGMPLQVRVDAYPGVLFEATLSWIGTSVDPDTRLVEARAALPNPQGLLKDGMFARARLSGLAQSSRVTVPQAAVQIVDGRSVVFAQLEDDLFEARLVDLGSPQGSQVPVLAGLNAGERVATGETYVLKSEFLKARLGAGCTDH